MSLHQLPCPRHPNRLTAPGLMVCSADCDNPHHSRDCEGHGCEQQLRAALRRIDDLWPELAEQHFAVTSETHTHVVHGSRPPCNLDVVEAMDASAVTHGEVPIAHTIAAWCRVVVEDRRLVAPVDTGMQARWLLVSQVGWLLAQDFAGEVIGELIDCARELGRLLGDDDHGTARCPATLADGSTCGAWLSLGHAEQVTCPRCHSQWHPARMLAVAQCDPGGEVWLDAEGAAEALRMDVRTVRAMGKRQEIPMRYGRYNVAAVRA